MNKRIKSFYYAVKGFGYAFKSQPNLRIHLFILILVILFGFLFRINLTEWGLITVVSGLVIALELINTSIELLTDIASPGFNKKAGHLKDLSAAAVLVSSVAALITGLTIFVPKILRWIQN